MEDSEEERGRVGWGSTLRVMYPSILNNGFYLLTVASGEESGEEGEGERVESLKAQQSQLEAEKQAILQNKELIDEVCTYLFSSLI